MAKMERSKEKNKKNTLPSKQTMNFVRHQSSFNPMKVLPVAAVLVVLALVAVKFFILDPLNEKTLAYGNLAARQDQLAAINAQLADYDELEHQYGRYSYGWMTADETNLVSRMDVLELVETKIANVAVAENISVAGNVLTLNVHGITLEEATAMIKDLESSPLVVRASMLGATAPNAMEAQIPLTITLTKEVSE